jgi:hypothetical protein
MLLGRVQATENEMIPAGKGVSGAIRGAAGYSRREGGGHCTVIGRQDRQTYVLLRTSRKYQAFRVTCSERMPCGNAFRNGSSKLSLTTKSCACAAIAFLTVIVSWPVGSTTVENLLQFTALFPYLRLFNLPIEMGEYNTRVIQ